MARKRVEVRGRARLLESSPMLNATAGGNAAGDVILVTAYLEIILGVSLLKPKVKRD